MEPKDGTVLFYPYISKSSFKEVKKVLSGRWIGQGPLVDKFEKKFKSMFAKKNHCISTGSGTDALHLAYILAGLKKVMRLLLLFIRVQLQTSLFYIWE